MAYGINAPLGLQTISSGIGNGGTQKLSTYSIYASPDGTVTMPYSIFSGDPVKFVSGDIIAAEMAGTIAPKYQTQAAKEEPVAGPTAADAFLGVFVSCTYYDVNNVKKDVPYWPGGSLVYPGSTITALVNDDPMAVFSIQVSTSSDDPDQDAIFLISQTGLNANLGVNGAEFNVNYPDNPITGNRYNGLSAYYLDGSTIANTANLDVKIIGLAPVTTLNPPNNLIPGVDMPFVNVLVRFNKHMYGSGGVAGPTPHE